jgi:hypothetical protein
MHCPNFRLALNLECSCRADLLRNHDIGTLSGSGPFVDAECSDQIRE